VEAGESTGEGSSSSMGTPEIEERVSLVVSGGRSLIGAVCKSKSVVVLGLAACWSLGSF